MHSSTIETHALLWSEEIDLLRDLAASVVDNGGVIVEIGTAYGASALIFDEATRNKNVSIYTIDKMPFKTAKKNLKHTNVHIINADASQVADQWKERVGRCIDLLFIDGDHNFVGIYNDFFRWLPWVQKGKIVLFHDYDPVQRGGIAHFAVRIFAETLADEGVLGNTIHHYKLFWGNKKDKDLTNIPIQSFVRKLMQIENDAKSEIERMFMPSFDSGVRDIIRRSNGMDSFVACLAVEYALKNDFEYLEQQVHNKNQFRQWAEILSVFEHAELHHEKCFSYKENNFGTCLANFSCDIALWQLKIKLLSMILGSLVHWVP